MQNGYTKIDRRKLLIQHGFQSKSSYESKIVNEKFFKLANWSTNKLQISSALNFVINDHETDKNIEILQSSRSERQIFLSE
jgi:hypothetical protein